MIGPDGTWTTTGLAVYHGHRRRHKSWMTVSLSNYQAFTTARRSLWGRLLEWRGGMLFPFTIEQHVYWMVV